MEKFSYLFFEAPLQGGWIFEAKKDALFQYLKDKSRIVDKLFCISDNKPAINFGKFKEATILMASLVDCFTVLIVLTLKDSN